MKIFNLFKKKQKVEPPNNRAIVRLSDTAKESGVYDDENKVIDLIKDGTIFRYKYSEADVIALREQGIPVIEEEYSDDFEFLSPDIGGGVEYKK